MDDLDDLRAAFARERPDPTVRAAHLAGARDAFDRLHAAPRPRRWGALGRLWAGGGLAASAVAAVLVLSPVGQDLWRRDTAGAATDAAEMAMEPESEERGRAAPTAAPSAPAPPDALAAEPPAAPEALAQEALADAGSYAAVRRSLLAGALPPPEAVRVGEVVDALATDRPLATASVQPTPWDAATLLVTVGGGAARADWDPAEVADARLVAGGRVAVFEVTPAPGAPGGSLGILRLASGASMEALIPRTAGEVPADARWAAAVAGWALLLRGEDLGGWGASDAAGLAEGALGDDPTGARAEAVSLMRLSAGLGL